MQRKGGNRGNGDLIAKIAIIAVIEKRIQDQYSTEQAQEIGIQRRSVFV
jgi:hypothetical protein